MRALFHAVCIVIAVANIFRTEGFAREENVAVDSGATQRASVTIQANVDSAWVFIDSVHVGCTPLTISALPACTHRLKLIHPDITNWLTGSISDSFVVAPGESKVLRYNFERWYSIITTPSGAHVYAGDSLAGATPLVLLSDPALGNSVIRIQKAGYEQVNSSLSDASHGILGITLKKEWQSGWHDESILKDLDARNSNTLRLYITGATTVLSGAAAAYFKIKADDRLTMYKATNNPSMLSETNHLDTASGISLFITQVSLALFAYFLLSE